MLEQRAICLIPIPFTDLSSSKRRPVKIISNDFYNRNREDILVMAITSHISANEYSISITQPDMESGNLKHESRLRGDKIYSIAQNLVIKTYPIVISNSPWRMRNLMYNFKGRFLVASLLLMTWMQE